MIKKLHLMKLFFLTIGLLTSTLWGQVTTFEYTGGMQTYVVPPGVISMQMELYGASGYGNLGFGGKVVAVLDVTPGETLNIFVGGAGTGVDGGYNGGGNSGGTTTYGGGGGASDVRQGGTGLANRVIVAGGGGGSGSNCGLWTAEGGHGGGLTGESGCLYSCSECQYTGAGGSQVAGGIAGPTAHGSCGGNSNGTLGVGGSNTGSPGTGGGGGYYGGGSGCYEGAGGGSSYTDPSATDVVHTVGVRDGNGQVILTVICSALTTEVSATELCEGDGLTLSASSEIGGTISWDMGVTDGVEFTPPVGTTTYTATSDADGDCFFTVDILVNEAPAVTASVDDEEICAGESVIFTGGGATTYAWSPADVTDGIAYTPTETATYTVTGTDDNGCTNEDEVEVIVHDLPDVVATVDNEEVCDGETFIFTGEGAASYNWDMGVVDGEPFTAGVGTTTYTVIGIDAFGCENEATISATVNPLPDVTATASETDVCFGDEVTFTGGGATTYDWDMGVTDGEPTVMDESGTITFTVIGTDDNGCENTANVSVTVAVEIVITYTTEDEITGTDGSIDITVAGGVAPYTFDWDNDETGDFDDDEDLSGLEAGTYTVVVQDDNGCTSTAVIIVDSQAGIADNAKNSVLIYPNPTTGFVVIEHAGTFNYEVTDISGDLILKANGTDKETLSLSDFANGIYFVTIHSNGATNTVKIIKN